MCLQWLLGLTGLLLSMPLQAASDINESSSQLNLPEVYVYSTKREARLLEVPSAIDVIDNSQILNKQVRDLYDISHAVSNLSVQQTGFYKSISLRGIGGGGRNAGFTTRVGVYLDGVYVGQTLALDNPIIDAEQVEVFKGPQGYLFGNNSDAGVINLISKQPSHLAETSIKSSVGNYRYLTNTFTTTGELTSALTGRLTMATETRDGYVNNVYNDENLKGFEQFAMRAQFKLEATESLNLNLSIDYTNRTHSQFLAQAKTGLFGQPIDAQNNRFFSVNRNVQPNAQSRSAGLHLKSDYFLNDATLTSITAYRTNQNNIRHDNDYSPVDLLQTRYQDEIDQFTQELRYRSAEESLFRHTSGVYLSRERNSNDSKAILGNDTNTLVTLPSIGFPLPFDVIFGVNSNVVLPLKGKVVTDTAAVFTNVDVQLTENMQLHAGGRLSVERRQLDLFMDGSQSGLLNMATVNHMRDAMHNTFFNPMIGWSYYPQENTHIYMTAARSYKNGGWNVEMVTQQQVNDGLSYDPESVTSLELGIKSKNANTDWGLSLFRNELKNYQVFQYANLGGLTLLQLRNAAAARTQGLEWNMTHALNDAAGFSVNLAYLDATYVSFPNGRSDGVDADGQRLPDAPRWNGNVSGYVKTHSDWAAGNLQMTVQQSFQSSTITGASNDATINRLSGRAIMDANLLYTADNQKWQFSIWVKNLLDKRYAFARSSDAFGNVYEIYAEPRLYGISGQYRF